MPTLNFADSKEGIFDLKTRVLGEMGSTKNCMNEFCRAATSAEWKKGWSLKSGGVAILCTSCGSAYENSVFCETFHLEDSGWRECRVCGKLVHCGCIASKYFYEYMDFGGIGCSSCAKLLEIQSKQTLQIPSDVPNGNFIPRADVKDSSPLVVESKIDSDKFNTKTLLQLALEHHRLEEPLPSNLENSKSLPNVSEPSTPSGYVGTDSNQRKQIPKNIYESIAHSPLSFSLSTPPSTGLPFRDKVSEGSEQSKGSFKARHGFPKPPKPSLLSGSETSKGASSQARVPRPPAEGRGRNQLLPRYWPRITDQELQQLSGDLKSTIVPLFEKILSASDAGRIGRLVLPKACAEAYFPTINQSEGIPIKIQDVKGKEWTFQFRFWPNNNSRMYVLEGVTPCIQNMQLQAGDTVIFSQRDPGGQLVIGCRKATNNVEGQDSHSPAIPTGDPSSDQLVSLSTDNLLPNGAIAAEDAQQNTARKKLKNIKNKRLLMNNDDATELRFTWEEAQELFRPASSAQPNVVIVDGYEFEEFQEPPVFGKRTIFISKPSGEQEQLAQCDSCHKWRRLPAHALLSANWTCSNNIWDLTRCSCSAVESINPKDLEFCGISNDNKKHRSSESNSKLVAEAELTGLDALATAAVLGDNIVDIGESSIGPTTRHPRHRPGCSCIVCIQPPSGKGKHEPTCKCNVCSTVRRRFKTLMMRKKKRQTEREAEKHNSGRDDMALLNMNQEETKAGIKTMDSEEASKGQQLDLNSDPRHEDESLVGMSLTTLINAANLPMDVYLNGGPIPTSETGSSCPAPAAAIDAIKLPSSMEDVKHGNKQGES